MAEPWVFQSAMHIQQNSCPHLHVKWLQPSSAGRPLFSQGSRHSDVQMCRPRGAVHLGQALVWAARYTAVSPSSTSFLCQWPALVQPSGWCALPRHVKQKYSPQKHWTSRSSQEDPPPFR